MPTGLCSQSLKAANDSFTILDYLYTLKSLENNVGIATDVILKTKNEGEFLQTQES